MALPNFLIVGAAKAGTTAIYQYIKQHPDIFMPETTKEPTFLTGLTRKDLAHMNPDHVDRTIIFDIDSYVHLFSTAEAEKAIGEASTAYLYFFESTIPRIKEILNDDVKIIIILRNPTDRIFSQYTNLLRDGQENRSFQEALEASKKKTQKDWWHDLDLDIGCYYRQVKAYLDAFGRDNVLIILYDDLIQQQLTTIQTIFRFLEVDDAFVPDISVKYNVTGIPKSKFIHNLLRQPHPVKDMLKPFFSQKFRQKIMHNRIINNLANRNLVKPQLPAAARKELNTWYQKDVLKLQELINRDLSRWIN
jgi:hypothetical protein